MTQILEPSLGAFLPRLAFFPGVLYGVVRAWHALLGMELTVFNILLVGWVGLIAAGWVASGWLEDQSNVALVDAARQQQLIQ